MNDTNIELEIAVFQEQRRGATGAFKGKARDVFWRRLWRRETSFPEVERFVNKSYAVGVGIALGADLTDDADVGFAIGFQRAENQFLLRNKFVTRQAAGAMQADDDGFSLFGENAAFAIAADQEDGIAIVMRPLRLTFWYVILATWGRGQESICSNVSGKRR